MRKKRSVTHVVSRIRYRLCRQFPVFNEFIQPAQCRPCPDSQTPFLCAATTHHQACAPILTYQVAHLCGGQVCTRILTEINRAWLHSPDVARTRSVSGREQPPGMAGFQGNGNPLQFCQPSSQNEACQNHLPGKVAPLSQDAPLAPIASSILLKHRNSRLSRRKWLIFPNQKC